MQTLVDTKRAESEHDYFPIFVGLIAIFSYIRVLFLNNIFWDDHCWLQSIYTSNDIFDFLNTGIIELRRVPQGIVLYPIWLLFKITDQAFTVFHLITITIQIITPVLVYLLNQYAIKHGGSVLASMQFYLFPVFAYLSAFLLLGEQLTLGLVVGGTLALLGVYHTLRMLPIMLFMIFYKAH